jgi:dGTPase
MIASRSASSANSISISFIDCTIPIRISTPIPFIDASQPMLRGWGKMVVMTEIVGTDRNRDWAATMSGYATAELTVAHRDSRALVGSPAHHGVEMTRERREEWLDDILAPGATRGTPGGRRQREEEPDPWRTCFERDRDRILHSSAFRRLAGKTQVFIFPEDHQRTRLTHALEVAQVATSVARSVGLNVALTEAIAIGHDCGHGPGGHASEDALEPYVPGGFNHAVWGADVALDGLNLCTETLDGIRNHSWSRPAPQTPEGEVVSWADRVAYVCHDFEDAVTSGIVSEDHLPDLVRTLCGTRRSAQLGTFIRALIETITTTGYVGMDDAHARALAAFRQFNYQNIYLRDDSRDQAGAVIGMLRALVEEFATRPESIPDTAITRDHDQHVRLHEAVAYVAGMTDRFACRSAVTLLAWPIDQLPRGIDR